MTVAELRELLGGMPDGSEVRIAADPGRGPSRGVRQLAAVMGGQPKLYIVPERMTRS